ncbi:MAG: hypothetical protein CMH30_06060 [Micavibrio sp.]|nr:hypothetical protein [Micavibrio sp.]|tara:strand:- start:875 stop:1219 length:345 start_codon:yes stop_codon:yes gene_type:complete
MIIAPKTDAVAQKQNFSAKKLLKQVGRFLTQKIITQPCCWLSFFPAARAFFFPEHNPALELGIGAILIIAVIEGGHFINHLRGKPTKCSRITSYGLAIAFYALAYLIAHIFFPH